MKRRKTPKNYPLSPPKRRQPQTKSETIEKLPHGGKREGAGRTKAPKEVLRVPLYVKVAPRTLEILRESGRSQGTLIDDAIAQYFGSD